MGQDAFDFADFLFGEGPAAKAPPVVDKADDMASTATPDEFFRPVASAGTADAPLPEGIEARVTVKLPDQIELPPRADRRDDHQPRPQSEWRPEWRPRKRIPGHHGIKANQAAVDAVGRKLKVPPETIESLPCGANGKPCKSDQYLAAMRAYVMSGGTIGLFAEATNVCNGTVYNWINRDPSWKEVMAEAKRVGADVLVEKALDIAENPKLVEEVTESYDKDGKLIRKDIRRADALYARKLAVSTCLDIAKKWAPEKYGDKLEVKTNDSLAARILAARRRTEREYREAEIVDVQ